MDPWRMTSPGHWSFINKEDVGEGLYKKGRSIILGARTAPWRPVGRRGTAPPRKLRKKREEISWGSGGRAFEEYRREFPPSGKRSAHAQEQHKIYRTVQKKEVKSRVRVHARGG